MMVASVDVYDDADDDLGVVVVDDYLTTMVVKVDDD